MSKEMITELMADRMFGYDEENKSKQMRIRGKWTSFLGISCATYINPLTIQFCLLDTFSKIPSSISKGSIPYVTIL